MHLRFRDTSNCICWQDALHSEAARTEESLVLKGVLEGCEQQVQSSVSFPTGKKLRRKRCLPNQRQHVSDR